MWFSPVNVAKTTSSVPSFPSVGAEQRHCLAGTPVSHRPETLLINKFTRLSQVPNAR